MPSLIGNKPNQVPTNGDLGTMAFRDQNDFYGSQQTMGFKNRIINGGMQIDQRNAGASVSASDGTFSVDRWQAYINSGNSNKFTMQQNAGSVTPPVGFQNYLGCTTSSAMSLAANDTYNIAQKIEGLNFNDLGWGTANAKPVTLSFWVYSSLTGTFGGSIANSALNRSFPFSYSIPTANTWTFVTITIQGDTTGTWLTNNGTGCRVIFSLGSGTSTSGSPNIWAAADYRSATGCVNVIGTNGATFYITGVQLEKGSTATSFDYRPYGTELALCQRYYFKYTGDPFNTYGCGYGNSSTQITLHIGYPVAMRTNPTFAIGGSVRSLPANTTVTGIGYSQVGTLAGYVGFNSSGITTNSVYLVGANNDSSAYLSASAEL